MLQVTAPFTHLYESALNAVVALESLVVIVSIYSLCARVQYRPMQRQHTAEVRCFSVLGVAILSKALHVFCPSNDDARYYPNYYASLDPMSGSHMRHYYRGIPDVVQFEEHGYMETTLCHYFAQPMLLTQYALPHYQTSMFSNSP